MIRKLLKGAKGYEVQSIFTVILVLCETALEVVLPIFMSNILNVMQLYAVDAEQAGLTAALTVFDFRGGTHGLLTYTAGTLVLGNADILLNTVYSYGILMVISAICSLTFGGLAGWLCAVAGAGFSKNMRAKLFDKIQSFSFANVDKFSTASQRQ